MNTTPNEKMYVHLYHGRKTPDEKLDDWGAEGPTFGPYKSVQITYRDHVKMHSDRFDSFHDLMWTDDLIHYGGMWYADVNIFLSDTPEALLCLQEYSAEKTKEASK